MGENAVGWLFKAQEARLKPEIITYSAVINACAKSGDMEKAVEWLSKAQQARLKPEIITYNTVINACAEFGDKNVALNLVDAMSLSRVAPDAATVSFVMRALVTASQVNPGLNHELFSSGFDLLEQIEHGTYESLKNETYSIHLALQNGLRDQKKIKLFIDPNTPKSGLQLA